jgi:hypothetical protein
MRLRLLLPAFLLALSAGVAACGGGESVEPSSTATPGTLEQPAPTPTPAASASVTPTAVPSEPKELKEGEALTIGPGMVVYYRVGCYACDGGGASLWRAYIDPGTRQLVREPLFKEIVAQYGGYAVSFSADWANGQIVVSMCSSGNCSGLGDGQASARKKVLLSRDLGVTWTDIGDISGTMGVFFAGEAGLVAFTGDAITGFTYRGFPKGPDLVPPGDSKSTFPVTVDGLGLVWQANGLVYKTATGASIPAAGVPGAFLVARDNRSGDLYYSYGVDNRPAIRAIDASGKLLGSWVAKLGDLSVEGVFSTGAAPGRKLYGTAHSGEGTCGSNGCQDGERLFRHEVVYIDLDAGTVQPFTELSVGLAGNLNPNAVHVTVARFAKVAGAGDCLNVRATPGPTSEVLGCFADGVLLGTNGEQVTAEGRTWLNVRTPDGRDGVAAAEFLRY